MCVLCTQYFKKIVLVLPLVHFLFVLFLAYFFLKCVYIMYLPDIESSFVKLARLCSALWTFFHKTLCNKYVCHAKWVIALFNSNTDHDINCLTMPAKIDVRIIRREFNFCLILINFCNFLQTFELSQYNISWGRGQSRGICRPTSRPWNQGLSLITILMPESRLWIPYHW